MANAVRNGGKMLALLAAGMFFSVGLSAKGDASPGLNIIGDANAKRTINGDRTVLTFTKSGKMRVVGSGTVEVLLVGGGGGGGRNHATDDNLGGGGGGGGGVVYTNSIAIREGIWDVSVGAGGEIGRNGCATTIEGLGLMAYGGGAGADNGTRNPDTGNIGWHGASGGGSTCNQPAGKAIYASSGNFGNDGAVAVHIYGAAGGGGAGAVAPAPSGSTPGNGGDGLEFSISGTATYYGGGGSGYRGGQHPVGGNGGGGYCANSRKFAGEDGLGGGGCGGTKGGSGVVIVSFVATDPAPVESELDIIGISNAVRSVQGERTILTLTKSGSVRVIGSGTIELLMVGGGGGGGANHATDGNLGGGGGGAGGVVYKSSFPVTKGVYDVAIGEGGAIGTNGGNTTIVGWGVTAYGGGAGGAYNGSAAGVANAKNGASGGGSSSSGTVGNAIYGDQGNFGHDGYKGTHQYGPGGGGGAGAAAMANPNGASTPGAGGDGLEFSISGTPTYYAGGGAGYRKGRGADSSWKAYGGNGGGGYAETNGKLHAGVDGLGGGGGGGTKGGSGIVIISFVAKASASPDFDISGADEVYKVGKERVLIFRQPGTMKVTGHGLMEVLAVGGGGGGGANHATNGDYGGGGGGGGGVFHMNSIAVSAGDYPVVIGEGGAIGTNGGHTKIEGAGVVAYGGGAGGACCDSSTNVGNPGADGASGGGSTSGKAAGKAIYSTAGNQGHDGYAATHQYGPGGGGGAGAAAVANPVSVSTPGAGGDGLEFSISGTPTYYAGGGAGYRKGRGSSYVFKAYGGLGGGGSASDAGVITPGIDGLGGGGCGGSKGGSGILIVRYTPPPPGMLLIVR